MNLLVGFLGFLLLAGLMVGWYLLHRRMTGEDAPPFGRRREDHAATELEAFIAAYRAGAVSPEQLKSQSPGAKGPEQASLAAESAPVFLRPEVKLAYLIFRAGLRDHHVFVNVRLADLAKDAADARVDLLVLNANFVPVAAIDVYKPGEETKAEKLLPLRSAGVRYLRLQTNAMPKPADVSALIYRA